MLLLSEADILELFSMEEAMTAVNQAFLDYETGNYHMPIRQHIESQEGSFLLMPCLSRSVFGTKLVSVFPGNADKKMPATLGMMLLADRQSGLPLSIMNGTILTAMRTGAIGGVSIRYLAPPDAHTVGLIGAGIQGLYQIIAACTARRITDVYIYNRRMEKVPLFITRLQERIPAHIRIHSANNSREVVERSDIVITATTSKSPVLPDEHGLFVDKHLVGVGSYQAGMREFPRAVFESANTLYVDTADAIHEAGDVIDPVVNGWLKESRVIPFAKVVSGQIRPARNSRFTAFKSVGMALFDVIVAQAVYEKAQQLGKGTTIEM